MSHIIQVCILLLFSCIGQIVASEQAVVTLSCSSTTVASKAVGFTAKYGKTQGNILMFTNVITNEGGGYDPTTSKFTCPVSGLYLFDITIVTSKPGTADILKNGNQVLRAYSGSLADSSDGKWDSVSNTVVLKLAVGDKVWVTSGGVTIDGDSNFSGVLIQSS